MNQALLDKSKTVKNKIEKYFYCRIKASLADLLGFLFEKCECLFSIDFWLPANTNNEFENKFLVHQVSADRSHHKEIQEGHTNIITFNLSIISNKLLKRNYTSIQS